MDIIYDIIYIYIFVYNYLYIYIYAQSYTIKDLYVSRNRVKSRPCPQPC